MKKFPIFLATALAMVFYASCSGDGNSPSGNENNGSQAAENGQAYNNDDTEKPYIGNAKIYMIKNRYLLDAGILDEETMLEVGTMNNGEITLAFPKNVDSRFLQKINSAPAGIDFEPLSAEMWFYTDPLILIDNNENHIGNLEYIKVIDDKKAHRITYFYFSEKAKFNGFFQNGTRTAEYRIDAKKGFNKVYSYIDEDKEAYFTTDLSKVPDGLMWLVEGS